MKEKNLTLPTLEVDEYQDNIRQLAIICGIVSDTMSTNYVSQELPRGGCLIVPIFFVYFNISEEN